MGAPLTMRRTPRMEKGTVILVSSGTASSLFRIELEFEDVALVLALRAVALVLVELVLLLAEIFSAVWDWLLWSRVELVAVVVLAEVVVLANCADTSCPLG